MFLERVDGHAGWANSEAMRRGKLTRETKAPPDGQILVDKDGEPTGVLIDGAMKLIQRVLPPPTKADVTRHILAAQELILSAGLTGIHDASVSRTAIEAYRDLDRMGKLRLRVYGMAGLPVGAEVAFVSKPPAPQRPGGRFFTLRAVKVFVDGAMGSRGGLLFEPYTDDPGNSGLMLIKPKTLEAVTTEAASRWLAGLRRTRSATAATRWCSTRMPPRLLRCRRPRIRASDRACAGDPAQGRRPFQGAGRDRVDAALTRQRRYAMGRRPPRPRPRRRRVRLALVP